VSLETDLVPNVAHPSYCRFSDERVGAYEVVVSQGNADPATARLPTHFLAPPISISQGQSGFLARLVQAADECISANLRLIDCFSVLDKGYCTLLPERGDFKAQSRRIVCNGRGDVVNVTVAMGNPDPYAFQWHVQRANEEATAEPTFGSFEEAVQFLAESVVPLESSQSAPSTAECGICYAAYLDGSLAAVACERKACVGRYHESCLRGWFERDPGTKRVFGRLIGTCLFCGNKGLCI
jgi:hypothetical protein